MHQNSVISCGLSTTKWAFLFFKWDSIFPLIYSLSLRLEVASFFSLEHCVLLHCAF